MRDPSKHAKSASQDCSEQPSDALRAEHEYHVLPTKNMITHFCSVHNSEFVYFACLLSRCGNKTKLQNRQC